VISLILSSPAAAQQSPAEEAQECFNHGNYGCALPLLVQLLKAEPDNALLNYQAGVCYLHSRSLKPRAVEFLEKAVEHSPSWKTKAMPGPKEAPLEAHKLLGGLSLDAEELYGTDKLTIHVFANEEREQAVICAVLDNLGKGASGQAVQNLELMLGLAHDG